MITAHLPARPSTKRLIKRSAKTPTSVASARNEQKSFPLNQEKESIWPLLVQWLFFLSLFSLLGIIAAIFVHH